jgi:hypothetical protein
MHVQLAIFLRMSATCLLPTYVYTQVSPTAALSRFTLQSPDQMDTVLPEHVRIRAYIYIHIHVCVCVCVCVC